MDYAVGHATAQPIGDDVVMRTAVVHDDSAYANPAPSLSPAEIEHFKREGYIVKRRLLTDARVFEQIVEHLWANVPRDIVRRDDPATWLDAPHTRWTSDDADAVGLLTENGNWKMRSRGTTGIGTEPFLVDELANHPNMLATVEAFLGEPPRRTQRVRGIYAVFPCPPGAERRFGAHTDYQAAQLAAMVIVDDIAPQGGGFTLWPGSHRRMHPHWDFVQGTQISDEKREGFRRARDAVLRDIVPVEFTGQAGDVVFWHPRAVHSAGINRTAESSPAVRLIVPCDYQKDGRTYLDDEEFGPGKGFQWWVDTRNIVEDVPATPANMWHDFAI